MRRVITAKSPEHEQRVAKEFCYLCHHPIGLDRPFFAGVWYVGHVECVERDMLNQNANNQTATTI